MIKCKIVNTAFKSIIPENENLIKDQIDDIKKTLQKYLSDKDCISGTIYKYIINRWQNLDSEIANYPSKKIDFALKILLTIKDLNTLLKPRIFAKYDLFLTIFYLGKEILNILKTNQSERFKTSLKEDIKEYFVWFQVSFANEFNSSEIMNVVLNKQEFYDLYNNLNTDEDHFLEKLLSAAGFKVYSSLNVIPW
jgi:hypothetical protein